MSLVNTFAAWGVAPSLAAQVSAILRKYGTDAHVYLPGIGIINGLTAGNYLDSAGTTAATVDNPVGKVTDANGAISATQATTANKPILRSASGLYSWQLDGTDFFSTGSPIYTSADNFFVCAGIKYASGAFPFPVCLAGKTAALTKFGSMFINSASMEFIGISTNDAGTDIVTAGHSITANVAFVGSILRNSTTMFIRKNGVSGSNVGIPTGVYTLDNGYIGVGSQEVGKLVGSLYPVICIKGAVTTADALTLEKFIGSLSGVTL